MQTLHASQAVRTTVGRFREAGETVALVPTMGALHAGHMALVEQARTRADRVVVSVFVNPLQFAPGEDYERYPRMLQQDAVRLSGAEVDLLFAPDESELFPAGLESTARIHVPGLSDILCGASRPGHFEGVATVVSVLFNIVRPDLAVFGEKDYQQLVVIRRITRDLHIPVEIIGVPTVREADGLALSSRNGYLTAAERHRATTLYATLQAIRERLQAGASDPAALEQWGRERLEAAGLVPDYVAIRRAGDLGETANGACPRVVLGAAWLGDTRLIDNVLVDR